MLQVMSAVSAYEGSELIGRWAELMDAHASAQIIADCTSADFMIKFGDTEMVGLRGLGEHQRLKDDYFDEHHLYYNYQVESAGPPLVMTTQMIWDSFRHTTGGSAEHLIADLRHKWTFVRQPGTGRPLFQRHELVEMNYRPGFAPSESDSSKLHIDSSRVGFGGRTDA
jgi:hypothetical protein